MPKLICNFLLFRKKKVEEEKAQIELQNRIILEEQKQQSTKITEEQQVLVYTLGVLHVAIMLPFPSHCFLRKYLVTDKITLK